MFVFVFDAVNTLLDNRNRSENKLDFTQFTDSMRRSNVQISSHLSLSVFLPHSVVHTQNTAHNGLVSKQQQHIQCMRFVVS